MSGELRPNLVALQTIVQREIRRYTRIWPQTLLPPAITMVLYFVIFGSLIGARIGDMDGFSYMDYIVPGLIMMSVITNSYSNVVSSFFSTKFQRSIEELLVSPVSPHVIVIGFALGGVMYGEVTLDRGRVEQSNFHDYRVLRIEEMPAVEVHIVPSAAAPTGVGEPGVPPVGPAVANAVFAATGRRIRNLPFTRDMNV